MLDLDDDIAALQRALIDEHLGGWADCLPQQFATALDAGRCGDIPRWQQALQAMPQLVAASVELDAAAVSANAPMPLDAEQQAQLRTALQQLMPWRKGPYSLFGVYIDTEWRSELKWQRLLPHITPLHDRLVLDIGCGNGYHCWRMRGAGARRVIGIDPMPLFWHQFAAVRQYCGDQAVDVIPAGVERLPDNLAAFDTVFSMGVLYHRRSPIDHLYQLKAALRPGGELVLETLVIDGDEDQVLLPRGRYARMRNVWFIPSVNAMLRWLQRCGFVVVRVVDVATTTTEEQRATEWMRFESLQDCLRADAPSLTVEGYPAPTRAIFIAERPL